MAPSRMKAVGDGHRAALVARPRANSRSDPSPCRQQVSCQVEIGCSEYPILGTGCLDHDPHRLGGGDRLGLNGPYPAWQLLLLHLVRALPDIPRRQLEPDAHYQCPADDLRGRRQAPAIFEGLAFRHPWKATPSPPQQAFGLPPRPIRSESGKIFRDRERAVTRRWS